MLVMCLFRKLYNKSKRVNTIAMQRVYNQKEDESIAGTLLYMYLCTIVMHLPLTTY